MVKFSGHLVDPCANGKDFKNKNDNSMTSPVTHEL